MKNKEKFAKELVKEAINAGAISVGKDGKVYQCCGNGSCKNCIAYITNGTNETCVYSKIRDWAEAEYVEPKVFTEEEKAFIRACDKIMYVARDQNNILYGYKSVPKKGNYAWEVVTGLTFPISFYSSLSFSAIKWEDAEPTSREEILK